MPSCTPAPDNHLATLCLSEPDSSGNFISIESYHMVLGLSFSLGTISSSSFLLWSRQYCVPYPGWVVFHHVDTPHLFVRVSVNGHPNCFHILSVMSSAAVNSHIWVFAFLLHIDLQRELLGRGNSVFNILKNCKLFSKVAVPFHSPTRNVWRFHFTISSKTHVFICLFLLQASQWMVSHCRFYMHYPGE